MGEDGPEVSEEDATGMRKLHLSEAQWARVLDDAAPTRNEPAISADAPWASGGDASLLSRCGWGLFLEGNAPHHEWRWYERWLDTAVQLGQPAPAMTHVEFLVPPSNPEDDMHFATYLGREAQWGRARTGNKQFYLDPNGNANSWRAVPIFGQDAARRLRAECDEAERAKTPYGSAGRLFNYPFSVPPGRMVAWMLDDEVGSPAHCASLSARCLRRALPELQLPRPSAWYGPSTLYLELARASRVAAYKRSLDAAATVKATVEQERAVAGAEVLLRGSDDHVAALGDEECQMGIHLLTVRTVEASVDGDPDEERRAQQQLARALLRWSLLNRSAKGAEEATPETEGVPAKGMFR